MRLHSLLTSLFLSCAGAVLAVPALPGLINVTQPDGSAISVHIHGDEHFHYYTDAFGNPLKVDENGFLVKSDDFPVRPLSSPQTLALASGKYTSYPTVGRQRALVVLVQFSDNSFTYGHESFKRMLNETGYSDYGAAGSARDYYIENSGGNFLPDFDVYGPVTLSHPMSYYSANDDAKAYEMVVEACRALDKDVDFSVYDRDDDGWVDNVYLFYAGYGRADGGSMSTVWPHSSNVYRKGTTLLLDGVQIGQYACSNELIGNTRSMVGIGTFCHEFGHVLGLPDLYSTSDSGALTVGYWSLMDHGNYADNGRCPVAMTAYERYYLGWTDPLILSESANLLLPSVDANIGMRVNGSDAEEYFLLEYRRRSGWDSYAPGEGLLVWHIDYDRDIWNNNSVNNLPSHPYVRLLPADGALSLIGDGGDTYPGTSGATSIPDFRSWNGASSGISITDIVKNGDYMTFKVNGGAPSPNAPTVNVANITDCEADVLVSGVDLPALLSVSYAEDGRWRYLPGYTFRPSDTLTTTSLTELVPTTSYRVTAYGCSGASLSTPSETTFRTIEPGIRYYAPDGLVASDVFSNTFTLSWDELPFANEYFLTVSHQGEGAAEESVVDFADKTNLPDGWLTTATNTISVNGYYGATAPALRLTNNAEKVESPVFAQPVKSLSLWLRGYQASAGCSLTVYGLVGGSWIELAVISPVDNSAGKTYAFGPETLLDPTALRFVYTSAGAGSVCLDDIKVGLCNTVIDIFDLDNVSVGNTTSYTLEGLEPSISYRCVVKASDGTHYSMPSDVLNVTTTDSSSVDTTVVENQAYAVFDIAGRKVADSVTRDSLSTLRPGIYIIRGETTVEKLIVR